MVEKMEKGKNNAMLQEAREHPNLESALGKFGITLKQVGHGRGGGIRYSTGSKGGREGDYSSLVFFKNPNDTWVVIDNKQRNGKLSYDALGALTELFGMRFADAVQLLSSGGIGFMAQGSASFKETGASEKPLSYLPEKIFRLPEKAPSAKHAAAYLTKARGIRGELVSELMHRGVIYEAIRKSPDGKEMRWLSFRLSMKRGTPSERSAAPLIAAFDLNILLADPIPDSDGVFLWEIPRRAPKNCSSANPRSTRCPCFA